MTINEKKYHLIFYEHLKKNKLKILKFHDKKFSFLYQRLLNDFKNLLNEYHGLNYNKNDWEIIISPWLLYILNIFLFYDSINYNKKNLPKKKLKVNHSAVMVPLDFDDFYSLISNYEFYKKNFFVKNIDFSNFKYKKIIKINKNSYLKNFVNLFVKKISNNKTIILNNIKISKFYTVKIVLLSLFKLLPQYTKNSLKASLKIKNSIIRKSFFYKLNKNNNHEKRLIYLLMKTMPSSYLENFSIIKKYVTLNFPQSNFFVSEGSYIYDDFFKINCFLNKKRKLFLIQHGGNMRIYKKNLHDLFESRVANKILVWGKKVRSKKEVFFSSTRLNKFKNNKINFEISKHKYCIILEPVRMFKINFFKINSPLKELTELVKFFRINKEKNFIIKLHYEKKNNNTISQNKILKICKLKKNNLTKDFQDVLKSDLVIFTYFSTMIFELLIMNKPFIIIIKEEEHFFSKFGLKIVDELKRNNIMFKNIEEFNNFFDKSSYIVKWNSKKNQKFLKNFKINYSNLNDDFSFFKLTKKI